MGSNPIVLRCPLNFIVNKFNIIIIIIIIIYVFELIYLMKDYFQSIVNKRKIKRSNNKKLKYNKAEVFNEKDLNWLSFYQVEKNPGKNDGKTKMAEHKFELKSLDYQNDILVLLDTYFKERKKKLQFLFPYIIEYGKMQSKFITTKYWNKHSLIFPFYLDFFNIERTVLSTDRYSNQYNGFEYKYISTSYEVGRYKSMDMSDSFVSYKIFYYKLKNLLKKQKNYHKNLIHRSDFMDNNNIVINYNKFSYYKYPRYIWTVMFEDPILEKFINLFVKHGNKEKIEKIFVKMFIHMNDFIHVNPLYIIKESIEVIRPYIRSKSIPFGRRTKTVPHPISEKQQIKLAMKWIKKEALENPKNVPFHFKLIETFRKSFTGTGKAYANMISMHTDAYNQRAYMYFNYFLKSSKVKHIRPF